MPNSQLFKSNISLLKLKEYFESICQVEYDEYIFDYNAFKKGEYNNLNQPFIEMCKPHYHLSKFKYVNCELTYKSLITVIRQICNYNCIKFSSKIKYEKSSYDIVYYIKCDKFREIM